MYSTYCGAAAADAARAHGLAKADKYKFIESELPQCTVPLCLQTSGDAESSAVGFRERTLNMK